MGATLASTSHFFPALIEQSTGVKFKYVSYEGLAPRMNAILGGHVDLTDSNLTQKGKVEAAQLKFLAIATETRHPEMPSVPTLKELFEEKYYSDLEGGILESFGRLFKNALKLYVYPYQDPATNSVITAGNLRVAPNLRHLYAYLMENLFIQGLRDINESCLPIFSRDVLARIRKGDSSWEQMVPPQVAALIKERKLFGWHA